MLHWRKNTRAYREQGISFDEIITADDFLATIVGYEKVSTMTDFNKIIPNLCALANVAKVEFGPDHLTVMTYDPAPFGTIEKLTEGVGAVDVIVLTPVADDDAARFRETSHVPQNIYDRTGNPDPQRSGVLKGLAADIGITTPPTLSAVYYDKVGFLFATVEDAQTYDNAR